MLKGSMRSLRLVICMVMLLFSFLPYGSKQVFAEEFNIIHNAGFESTESGVPLSWTQDVWEAGESISRFTLEQSDVYSGTGAAKIQNFQPNHAKWIQKLTVSPDAYYHVSGWVKVSDAKSDAIGANLFIVGVGDPFPQLTDTVGEWKLLEFYGRTGPEQKELQMGISLGGYGSLNTGTALFDDLKMEQLPAKPENVQIISFEPSKLTGGGGAASGTDNMDPKKISAFPVLSISALFGLLFVFLYRKMLRTQPLGKPHTSYRGWLIAAMAAALIFRLWVAIKVPGYVNDIKTFMYWADRAYQNGVQHFYEEGVFADYPPGYVYILYVLAAIKSWFSINPDTSGATLLFKLPAIVADLVSSWLIYRFAKTKLNPAAAAGLALLYVWNPAIWINSAGWGQVDSFFTLFLIMAISSMAGERLERGGIWFALAVLIKPQALIFAPVVLLAYWHKRDWKRALLSVAYGIIAFLVFAAPFFLTNGGLIGVIELYKATLSSYPYATLNAFNLYALTGGNWAPLESSWLALSYKTWGNIAIALAVIAALWFSFKGKPKRNLGISYFIAIILITIVFLFATKMHERYLFPVILLYVFAYIESQDRRLLHLLMGFSVTHFINVGYVLAFSEAGQHTVTDGIVILCSITNLCLFAYLLYVGYSLYVKNDQKPVPPLTQEELREADRQALKELEQQSVPKGKELQASSSDKSGNKLTRKDWWWMGGITAVYAIVALLNLGSFNSLNTGWKPQQNGQSFYVDLGQTQQLERVNMFGGVGSGKLKLEFGNSPDAWSGGVDVELKIGDNLKWVVQPLNVSARYAKVTVASTGFSLQEMAFYPSGSDQPLPIGDIVYIGSNAAAAEDPRFGLVEHLFDEQSSAAYKSTYWNGSYFDEIYHARTAYEFLEDLTVYENTHPPLGKILIAIGIKLFGLSPFGWRIIGTLFGIAMIPLMYIFVLRLFRYRTVYAAAGAILLAADFMHFTQTRIATIDVYAVFFIMLMFYFMYRYYRMNFYLVALGKTLVPLSLAGVVFGIGAASKWIVIYGGAGLAIMLGLSLFDRYKQYAASKRALASGTASVEQKETYKRVIKAFPRNALLTLASCLITYIAIPVVIYSLSFMPVLNAGDGKYTIEGLVSQQEHMYSYHSELVATHPYSSQWWEWPFMKRPVWYYSGKDLENPNDVSSISAFGNPLIWWTGLFALIGAFYISLKRKDKRMYIVWIAYLSQYLPWMLVPRLTFIYHYFAMVPFMIMAILYMFQTAEEKNPKWRKYLGIYVAAAVVLFIMFYPVLSGLPFSKTYVAHILRWFPSWVLYSG